MFDLEQSIAEWRRQMLAAGVNNGNTLDELESHLRHDIAVLTAAGRPDAEAFSLAVRRFGTASAMRCEFDKISTAHIWPVKVGVLVLAAGAFLQSPYVLAKGADAIGAGQFILVVVGYLAAFLAGTFGICDVCFRMFHALTPRRQQSLNRAINLFSLMAAILVLLSFVLGLIWVKGHFEQFSRSGRLPYAVGTGCMCVWLVVVVALQSLGLVRNRANARTAIAGGFVILLSSYPLAFLQAIHGHGIGGHWIFAAILAVHLCFLILACTTQTELQPSSD